MRHKTDFPPHIRSLETIAGIFWDQTLSLLPALGALMFVSKWQGVRLIGTCLSAAFIAEALSRKLAGKKITFYDGSSVLLGCLLSLMLPPQDPAWVPAFLVLVSVIMGREIFGGVGSNPFHPAVIGIVLSQIASSHGDAFKVADSAWHPVNLMILGGGFYLIIKKIISIEIPLIYIASFFLVTLFLGSAHFDLPYRGLFICAFYLMADTATTPLTKAGLRIYALISGVTGAVLTWASPYGRAGIYFGMFISTALVPWLDGWIQPKSLRFEKS